MILEIILIVVGVLLLFSILFVGWCIGVYNTMVTAFQDVKGMIGNMKTEYQRRSDFFMNLSAVIKGNARFEKETLKDVIAMRNVNFVKNDAPKATLGKMKQLDGIFGRLLVTVERYPQLQANKIFQKGLDEIRITEDRINVARTEYNNIVNDFNQYIKVFPNSIISGMFKFDVQEYYENDPGTDKAPKMDLEV